MALVSLGSSASGGSLYVCLCFRKGLFEFGVFRRSLPWTDGERVSAKACFGCSSANRYNKLSLLTVMELFLAFLLL